MNNKAYSMISLAKKAGKLMTGSDVCEIGLKSNKIDLLIISEDASEGTKKNFENMCKYRNIDFKMFGDRKSLGKFTGKDEIVIIGICDKGFSDAISRLIDESRNIGGI